MAVPQRDFYTLTNDGRNHGAPRTWPYDPSPFGDDVMQGELMGLAAGTAVRLTNAVSSGSGFIGVSRDSPGSARKLGLRATEISVWTSGVHLLRTTNGEVYAQGATVYRTGGSVTDQITNGGAAANAVGTVLFPIGTGPITGTGQNRVPIIIDQYVNYAGV